MSELTKKPEFWISAAALLVGIVGSGYSIKQTSDLKKKVDGIDQVVGAILQKLTPQGQAMLAGLDALVAHDASNEKKFKRLQTDIQNVAADVAEIRENQTRIFRALEALMVAAQSDKKDFTAVQQILGMGNPYGMPGYGQPPPPPYGGQPAYGQTPYGGPPPPQYGGGGRGGHGHGGGRQPSQRRPVADGNDSDDPVDRRH